MANRTISSLRSTTTPPNSIDLQDLKQREPEAAQYGYWLNNNATSGVDLDGDPMRLTWREFQLGSTTMQAAYPNDPLVEKNIMRLNDLFTQQLGGQVPDGWTKVLGIDLPVFTPKAGPATAFGGFRIERKQTTGTVRIAMPSPTPTALQTVGQRRLLIVDEKGSPLNAAITRIHLDTTNPDAHFMVVEVDLSKLTDSSHVRWEGAANVRDRLVDLTSSVPLPKSGDFPPEATQWLESAPMIQTKHPLLIALAAQAKTGATDMQSLVSNTLQAIKNLRRDDWEDAPLDWQNDALAFAQSGYGECVAHANLFAALMRINGVPTRIVSGILRGTGYPGNMHYRNEYYVPNKGWVYVEPQELNIQSSRVDMVETGRISAAMEQQGDGFQSGPQTYRGVIAGTMIATEVDSHGKPVQSGHAVSISEGLFVRNSSVPGPGIAIHGAR